MAEKIIIGGTEYAASINGCIADRAWDGRDSKTITLEMTHAEADELFVDGAEWSIKDADGTEYDNSDYCIAGDIIDHRDGTISVKMGKSTDLEDLLEMLYGELSVGEVRE